MVGRLPLLTVCPPPCVLRPPSARSAERERSGELERTLQVSEAAAAQSHTLQLQLADACRARDEHLSEVERLRATNAELHETTKVLKVNIDKLSRAQQEMLTKARKADDALRGLQADKEAAERSQASTASKAQVQERQLKTFLQANEALEADLRKQLARVAQLERRKQERDAERRGAADDRGVPSPSPSPSPSP